MMSRSDDDLIVRLVEGMLATPESEREGYLRGACAGDGDLFGEVWSRVQWEERMKGFLAEPVPWRMTDRFFEPGQLLAERFRLLREVGDGGMGVVYEAHDQRLDKHIAVKCPKPRFEQRLPPEAKGATHLAHPNLCRVFEIHTESTPDGKVDFLTMELLDGETLSASIRRHGRLPVSQVRDLTRQLCSGLEEAHRNGVIHGDLKPGNIILVERDDGETRAVITDFGLARLATGARAAGQQDNERGGTFAYMAPELFRGEKSSVASDLYALGAILYEALSGRRPFADNIDPQRRPERLPKLAPIVGRRAARRLDWILSRCLDPDPTRRPASAAEVSSAIALLQAAPSSKAVLATLMTALSIPFPLSDPLSVAVLAFDTSPEQKSLAEGVLVETGTLLRQVKVPGWRFSTIPVSESIDQEMKTPQQARLDLGATHVLQGTLQQRTGVITVRAKVTDTRSLRVIRDLALEFPPADVQLIPRALAGIVTGSLRLPSVPENPMNPEAYRYYIEGLGHLRHESRADDAIASLEQAAKLDPSSAPVGAALAQAYFLKYKVSSDPHYDELAHKTARRAEALNPDSPSVHMTAGMLLLESGHYARAAERFQRTVELNPNASDAWRRLARAYESMGQPQQALWALQKAISVEPRYYMSYRAIGTFYYNRAEYGQAVEQFRKAVELAPGEPEVHFILATGYAKLGRLAEAEGELRIALALRETVDALISLGAVLAFQGRDAESIPFYKRAGDLAPNNYLVWMNLADACRRTNVPGVVQQAYTRALQLTRQEIERNPQNAYVRGCIAYLLARLGYPEEAEHEIRQSLALPSANADTRRMAVRTYECLGRRKQTLEVLKDAPRTLLEEIAEFPEMKNLRQDPGFIELLTKPNPE